MIRLGLLLVSFLCCIVTASVPSLVWAASARLIDGGAIEMNGEIIRISNIETPGIRTAECEAERRLGMRARKRVRELVRSGSIAVQQSERVYVGSQPGRLHAKVEIDGADLGNKLIAEGLARPWTGKRRSWCS